MKKFIATAFIIMPAVCFLLLVQPGIGKADMAGTWKGKGVDKRGVKWGFTFTLTQKDDVLEGGSSWEGSDGSSAKSTLKGTINLAKRTFILNDSELKDVSGDVRAGTYTGSFSPDFNKMTGKWTVPNGSPGTFKAEGSWKADIAGTWKGKGEDTRGVKWEFTFTLTQKDNVLEGGSKWEGSDGSSATSTMKGTINFAKRTLVLNDVNLDDVSGVVSPATYTGSFSTDFKKMTGKWTILNGGSPGTFEMVKGQ